MPLNPRGLCFVLLFRQQPSYIAVQAVVTERSLPRFHAGPSEWRLTDILPTTASFVGSRFQQSTPPFLTDAQPSQWWTHRQDILFCGARVNLNDLYPRRDWLNSCCLRKTEQECCPDKAISAAGVVTVWAGFLQSEGSIVFFVNLCIGRNRQRM
jgi:hypothetical protein